MINEIFQTETKLRLQDYVNYNSERPVGINALANAGGGITIVAFEAGQELPDHKAPADVLVMVLEGDVVFNFPDKSVELGAGDSMFMTTGIIHNVRAINSSKVLLTKIS